MQAELQETQFLNFSEPSVAAFTDRNSDAAATPRERAVSLYFAVRDQIRYDPYIIDLSVEGLRASTVLATQRGWCVSKAVLLGAACRAAGIPARLGYADVKNHLSTERMRREMGTDEFYWHGYTDILLDGRWVKATPAFNIELCEKFRIKPLDFDGTEDSIYHPFDLDGREHMEYLAYRGDFDDVPLAAIQKTFKDRYPAVMAGNDEGDFDADVERETQEQS
ncbi:MAG: transglutaminase family protein [Pseudomonadota bacterium]